MMREHLDDAWSDLGVARERLEYSHVSVAHQVLCDRICDAGVARDRHPHVDAPVVRKRRQQSKWTVGSASNGSAHGLVARHGKLL